MRITVFLLIAGSIAAQDLRVAARWTPLPDAEIDGALHRAALRTLHAERDGKPVQELTVPPRLTLRFRTEGRTFLLGEPILVGLRIELQGPGEWKEWVGGNYRARGRDDNFLFLLRRSDGTWLPDVYGKLQHHRGGLSSAWIATAEKPFEVWNAVQRWAAIDAPGDYELHALYRAHGHDVVGGAPDLRWGALERSPLAATLDPAVKTRAAANHWPVDALTCYARIPIVVRPGKPSERARMVDEVTARVSDPAPRSMGSREAARVDAVTFARQDDFLALLAMQYRDRGGLGWLTAAQGLAIRPSPEAFEVLVGGGPAKAMSTAWMMCRENARRLMPHLIGWLGHEDEDVRNSALTRLRHWTGDDAPKSDDRETWRAWWTKSSKDFVPKPWRE